MRILLVEDNARFRDLIVDHLRSAGYAVDAATTVEDFEELAAVNDHDLYLVDLGLPDGDGVELIKGLRAQENRTPVLITTARASVEDRIEGLDGGADDYLTKPFNHQELLARIRAVLRRSPAIAPTTLEVGHLMLDCRTGDVYCAGKRVDLRPSEQRLLALLIRRAGRLVARSAIESALQSMGSERTSNAVDKLVSRLRHALNGSQSGLQLKTVRGAGYVLEEEM